jgi:OOP family OmpA-OmpF porin
MRLSINFRSILFCILIAYAYCLPAQNLVPNHSFENWLTCPGSYSQAPGEFQITDWYSANLGTPDYFHACSTGQADVPYNWAGISEAYDGNGYIGIYTWMAAKNYVEYLQCKLLQPLQKDSLYVVEFHYKLSSYSNYSINTMGLILTDSMFNTHTNEAITLTPTLSIRKDSAFTPQTGRWELAQLEYKAKGNEKYLTIGNFYDVKTKYYKIKSRSVSEPMLAEAAYYYIDDVKVEPKFSIEKINQLVPEFVPEKILLNTTYRLKNIQFEFNSAKLHPSAYEHLDNLAEFLMKNPSIRVQLSGHTDDVGDDAYNAKLSRERAKRVAAYLISRGIKSEDIETFGYGKKRPLINETTEEARKINRRVEVKFIR